MSISSLMRLEARKIKIHRLILFAIPITLVLIYATFVSIYGINQTHASSFAAIIKMMTATVWDFYFFYTAYLVSKIIVEEYVNCTVMILFTYSIPRRRIFFAKILSTSVISLPCQAVSQTICFIFLLTMDRRFSLVNGFITRVDYIEWTQYVLIDLLAAAASVLFLSAIAVIRKSSASVFLYGITFLFVYQVIISQINEFSILWPCYTALFLGCAFFSTVSIHRWMNRLTAK